MRYKQHVRIVLSKTSGTPLYEQIVDQVRTAILTGGLRAGDPLPSLRQLARDLEVSLITTTRAYNDLASQGLIANHQGRGSFVLPLDPELVRRRLEARLDEQAAALVATARLAGMLPSDLHERIDSAWTSATS
ncbi:GntR family transcriptional regulator [Schaalia naturae]|jgi:GntR family transcriptional regulator|uniref:GntR family transcriptional regulator n=1 Tax=Schaalia naturae TaxID=635203 RepID=UPI0036D3F264